MDPYTLVAMASAEDDDRRSAPRLALLTVGRQATSDGIPPPFGDRIWHRAACATPQIGTT
jgi:hypothetical protein